ncbi:hypothetical protein RHMOL_Rhmol06G0136800 [Rhododendron molle]|uniref:Uncharacterized protein n=1 Tax=Rhododendron molle TaxID=49168 RepID=A0ACC0NCT5_RHOML|nr:hypothetical protein RHMOL_Rhmol06G0136800 [Rhododendron molle]
MADHGNGGGGGEVVDQSEDRGGPMETQLGDQRLAGAVKGESAAVEGGGDGRENQEQEVGGEVEPVVQPPDPSMAVAASSVPGSGLEDTGHGGDGRTPELAVAAAPRVLMLRQSGLRRGIRPATTAATSLSHRPITKYDVAEHLPDEALAKLLEDNPIIDEIVFKAQEDRARAIAELKAAERAERERVEREETVRDMEAEERAAAEAQWPRVKAVDEAAAVTRPDFSAEAYIPPTPLLFVPSGFAAYVP